MSSATTVRKRVVERYIEGFRAGDHEMIIACVTDDVTWDGRTDALFCDVFHFRDDNQEVSR